MAGAAVLTWRLWRAGSAASNAWRRFIFKLADFIMGALPPSAYKDRLADMAPALPDPQFSVRGGLS